MTHNSIPAVSVIVPVYNVAPYIERCARSLFEQTLESLEIIFVDDCSPDNSCEIIQRTLDEYPSRQERTRIIHSVRNGGLAAARHQGLLDANGRYVIHCDGDDWVDFNLYGTMYDCAIKNGADIVVSDEVLEYKDTSVRTIEPIPSSNGKDLMRNWYRQVIGLFCHNKLVKRDLYFSNNVLPWNGLNMWEDNALFARLFYYARNVVQLDPQGPVYHYNRSNVNAMTSGYGMHQINQMIAVAQNLSDFFENQSDGEEFKKTSDAFKYLAKLNLVTDSFSNYKRFRAIFPESDYISDELDIEAFSTKGKIRFKLVTAGLGKLFVLAYKAKNILN